jgi:hypothetical protein
MALLLEMVAAVPAANDEADMGHFDCRDKLDNQE